jgi:hypothetical protein
MEVDQYLSDNETGENILEFWQVISMDIVLF